MPEEAQQQSANAGLEPTEQVLVSSPPIKSAEPAAVSTPELPVQESVESEPPPDSSEDSSTPSEPQRSDDATTQPSEEAAVPTTIETIQPVPGQPTAPAEPQPPSSPETTPDIQPVPEESFFNSRELENKAAIETSQNQNAPPEPQERIIERVREMNESEKEQLFKTQLKSLSPKGVSARRSKRQANYNKIVAHLKTHGFITNNDVEKLCRVKDRTAFQYLQDLERQGTIMQLGKTGRVVRYRLTQGITL